MDSIISVNRVQKPYRVQINDLLSVRVKALDQEVVSMFNPVDETVSTATTEEALFFNGYTVDDRGNIRIPRLGNVFVLGLTTEEIQELLKEKLLASFFKPTANIFVTVKLPGIRYTTLGEIGSGSQVIYKEQITIMEAIAQAGGIDDLGDRTDVVIVRQNPEGQQIHHINLTQIEAVNSPVYYIQPNDLILVNPLPQKSTGFGITGLNTFQSIASIVTLFTSIVLLSTRL
ncbi:polysaccharide biosynthesis/export family protein [Gangjinia marincola]|uniref:Polysaccharide biosynthesis/export family protein n=1 Tax=Gangjinia marincola TaxID=578463 RepID=A0ABN1MDS4_9FLAO